MNSTQSKMPNLKWGFLLLVFIFGVWSAPWDLLKWSLVCVFLHGLPSVLQLTRNKVVRIYGTWFAVFLFAQAILSFMISYTGDFKTLPPGFKAVIDVTGDGLPGIQGLQHISYDSKGFRTTKEIIYESKDPGAIRIFTIGGSTTENVIIDDGRTWPNLLQEMLGESTGLDVSVINTGVSGTRARHHLATLKVISRYKPDIAVILPGINDWNRHITRVLDTGEGSRKGFSFPACARYKLCFNQTLLGMAIERGKKFLQTGQAANNPETPEVPVIRPEDGRYYTNQNNSLSRPEVKQFSPEEVDPDYRRYLELISDTCRERQIKCVFLTQPTAYKKNAGEAVKKRFWMTPPNRSYTLDFESMVNIADLYNGHLVEFGEKHGHVICDIAGKVEPSNDYFFDDCHFNTKGSRLVATLVSQCMLNAGILR